MAKTVLRYEDEEFSFLLIGISTTYADFRLCGEINKALDISLERVEDYTIHNQKSEEELSFPFFSYSNDQEDSYHVIGNKSIRGLLIPEQKSLDYFLLIKQGQSHIDAAETARQLKPIRLIQAAFILDPYKLKSKENLLF